MGTSMPSSRSAPIRRPRPGASSKFERSRAGSDNWTVLSPPGHPTGRPVIGVHGDTLWVMYFNRSPGLEWISRDDGNLWVRGSMPCQPDLGGTFGPVSNSVIWAFCATGHGRNPSVSTNGGITFSDPAVPVRSSSRTMASLPHSRRSTPSSYPVGSALQVTTAMPAPPTKSSHRSLARPGLASPTSRSAT